MGLDYSFVLIFKRQDVWKLLESVAEISSPGSEQTSILFPDHTLKLPLEAWADTPAQFFFDDLPDQLQFMTCLDFTPDKALIDYAERYNNKPNERPDGTKVITVGVIYLTVFNDPSEWGSEMNSDLMVLQFSAATSNMSILFCESDSIRTSMIRLLEKYEGVCGILDREDSAELIWWRGREISVELPNANLELAEIENLLPHEDERDGEITLQRHYCLACGNEFLPIIPEDTLCPLCSGEQIPLPDQPKPPANKTVIDIVPSDTPAVAYCIIHGGEFTPSSPDEIICPQCRPSQNTVTEPAPVNTETKPPPENSLTDGGRPIPEEWQPGDELLNTYTVLGLLGKGGQGSVYRVHHKSWNIDLAVKSPIGFKNQDLQKIFIDEAETWIELGLHPHIVTCYYVRNIDNVPRVFAELVEGGSLTDWIKTDKIAGTEKALDIAIQFAWGLAYAHEQGLVHRDVKPDNVLMTPDGTAKVTDFGLVRAGRGMTPAYVSPEQAEAQLKDVELTQQSDIWSWGLAVLEMFAGRPYWVHSDMPDYAWGQVAPAALEHYLSGEIEEAANGEMPSTLADLLRQCFQMEPSKRPASMVQVAERLCEIYAVESGQTYPRQRPTAADLRSDSLNNKALSFLDLGKSQEAISTWQDALKIDPLHAEVNYNLGMWLWDHAQMTDLDLVRKLEVVTRTQGENWMPHYLLGVVHTKRHDLPAARQALEAAARLVPGNKQVQTAIQHLDEEFSAGCLHTIDIGKSVVDLAITPDGCQVVVASQEKTLSIWDLKHEVYHNTLQGHENSVATVAITPDGRQVVSGSSDKTVRVWDLASGKCLRTLEGHTSQVLALAISPDGRQVVSGSQDGSLRLWDLASGKCLRTLDGHNGIVFSLVITPDGSRVVSGSWDTTLRVWDLATGKCLRTLVGHTGAVEGLTITPDGRKVISGSWDHTLRVWDLELGVCSHTLRGHTDPVKVLAITPNGRLVISGSDDQTVRVWDIYSGICIRTLEGHTKSVFTLAPTPDGHQVVSGSGDQTLRVWQLPILDQKLFAWEINRPRAVQAVQAAKLNMLQKLEAAQSELHKGQVGQAASILRQALLIPGFEHDAALLNLWDAAGRRAGIVQGLRMVHLKHILEGHTQQVGTFIITPDGRWIVSGSNDQTLRVWELANGKCLRTLEGHTGSIIGLVVSPDGRQVISGSLDATLRVWDLDSGECQHILQGHTDEIWTLAITPDGCKAISGGDDKSIRIWDMASGECLRILKGHTDRVQALAITPDGRLAISGSWDETLRVWDLERGACLNTLQGHNGHVYTLAVTPDGRQVISGNWDNTLHVWDLERGICLRTLIGHTGSVEGLIITQDGCRAISGSTDETLRVWDLGSGKCLHTVEWLTIDVDAIGITPDGRQVVSGAGPSDHILRIWDLATGKCLHTMEGHTSYVEGLTITRDGRHIISSSCDKTLRVWEIDWDFAFPDPADWDEGARPYLDIFLALHMPYSSDGFKRRGRPVWSEDDFQKFLMELGRRGYGWLRPEGVRRKLEEMAMGMR